jgi:chromosome segregation ATPase
MFNDLLWVAFLIEWLTGVAVGWWLARFFTKRKSGAAASEPDNMRSASRLSPTGSNGKAAVLQALAQDRTTTSSHLHQVEQTLAATEAQLKRTTEELGRTQTAQLKMQEALNQREEEIRNLRTQLAAEQARVAGIAQNANRYKTAASEAQVMIQALDQSKTDIGQTAIKLQADLEAALQSRDKILQQLAAHKERLRIVTGDLVRAEQGKSQLEEEIQTREQQIKDLKATVAQLRSRLTSDTPA